MSTASTATQGSVNKSSAAKTRGSSKKKRAKAAPTLAIVPKARLYELVYILRPNLEARESEQVSAKLQEIIESFDGKLLKVDTWGLRKLAYAIQRHKRGVYVYVKFASAGPVVLEIERNLRLLDAVIRYQTVKLEDTFDLDSVEVNPDEIAFTTVEVPEDDDEPTLEERLGMASRRSREARADSRNDDDSDERDDNDGDDNDSDNENTDNEESND